jgi:hypothetical protein
MNNNVETVWFEYRNRLARTANVTLGAASGLTLVLVVIAILMHKRSNVDAFRER